METPTLELNGRTYPVDENGFLRDIERLTRQKLSIDALPSGFAAQVAATRFKVSSSWTRCPGAPR